uniref:Uncharacterized protein n=1 Tax=Anopheles darlingi TaxID=43151 RepID=A0A2M4DPL4_ANODA
MRKNLPSFLSFHFLFFSWFYFARPKTHSDLFHLPVVCFCLRASSFAFVIGPAWLTTGQALKKPEPKPTKGKPTACASLERPQSLVWVMVKISFCLFAFHECDGLAGAYDTFTGGVVQADTHKKTQNDSLEQQQDRSVNCS